MAEEQHVDLDKAFLVIAMAGLVGSCLLFVIYLFIARQLGFC